MKVLIVDDQISVHQFLARAIDWSFYGVNQPIYVFNGQEALEIILDDCPDMVILDIKMPVMTGLELLQELNTRNIQPKTIILSAYHEFEYAQEAMKYGVKNYILKPIDPEQLESAMASLIAEKQFEIKKLAEQCLSEIAHEIPIPNPSLIDDMGNIFIHLNFERYLVAVISCRQSASELTVQSLLKDLKKVEYPNLITTSSALGQFYLIIPMVSFQPEVANCQPFINLLLDWNRTYQELDLIIGFSRSSSAVSDIYTLFDQALKALEMSFYNPGPIFYPSSSLLGSLSDNTLKKLETNILNSIQMSFPEEKLLIQIKKFFDFFRSQKISPNIVYRSCYDLLLFVKLNFPNFDEKKAWNADFSLESYRKLRTIEELEVTFTRNLLSFSPSISPDSAKVERNIILQIKYYAEKCYDEDLSLDAVATKFFISKYRLSRLFKKETGENYWDFVTRVRMEKALFLLTHSNLKTYEVASKVGYEDICYFSTLFKKFFGKSPKNFRQSAAGENHPSN